MSPLTRLLDTAYAGATDPGAWPTFLAEAAAVFGGAAVLRMGPRRNLAEGTIAGATLAPSAVAAYAEHFADLDLWSRGDAAQVPDKPVVVDEELVDRAELEAGAFYVDWLAPQGLRHSLRCRIATPRGQALDLLLLRHDRYRDADQSLAVQVLPHLRRAVEIGDRLSLLIDQRRLLGHGFERLGASLLIVDADARIRFANGTAESLLAAGDGLRAAGERLSAPGRAAAALAMAIRCATRRPRREGALLLVPRRHGPPLSVSVNPVAEAHRPTMVQGRGLLALVTVHDPAQHAAPESEHLQALYGITPAEARLVLALCAGRTLAEHARDAGVTLTTVKTHLRSVFLKTGVRRQPELVLRMTADTALRFGP
jgi:DNA-binding CsgD family transcriptional regulator